MQISLKYHAKEFEYLEDILDPENNVEYGAKFLRSLYNRHKSWNEAISRYHSSIPKNKIKAMVPTWSIKKNQLYKKFIFSNFSDALGFIVQVGIESEKLNHHPNIQNTYNKVEIYLSTHSINGLSNLDVKLANNIDNL